VTAINFLWFIYIFNIFIIFYAFSLIPIGFIGSESGSSESAGSESSPGSESGRPTGSRTTTEQESAHEPPAHVDLVIFSGRIRGVWHCCLHLVGIPLPLPSGHFRIAPGNIQWLAVLHDWNCAAPWQVTARSKAQNELNSIVPKLKRMNAVARGCKDCARTQKLKE